MQKKEVCVWWGGGGIVGFIDLINTLKLGKEVLSDTWHSFPKWGDGKLRKKRHCQTSESYSIGRGCLRSLILI